MDRKEMGSITKEGFYDAAEMEEQENENDDDDDQVNDDLYINEKANNLSQFDGKSSSSRAMSFFNYLTGQKPLSEEDLTPVLIKMKEHLINKNVAADIATHLCDSVSKGLIGKKLGGFNSIRSEIKRTMEPALQKILTPRTSIDLLRDILSAKKEKRPYSIVFVGVNGVGKSTNLSKVCFWLLQNKLKILIAACDTFRSGAVEQLRVHARNLSALTNEIPVELFERGYGKDSASIAKNALEYGKIPKC